jgi:Icc protein
MSPRPVRLVQFTDTHLVGSADGRVRGMDTAASLQAVLAAAAEHIAAADALLLTGDLVQDDIGGYARIRGLLGGYGKPVLCIPGNHDDATELALALAAPPFQTGGRVDLGGWRVLLIDSSLPRRTEGAVSAAALQRLESELASAGGQPVLVVLHHPPVPLGSRWVDELGVTNAAALWQVLDRHAAVRGVLFGHAHQAFDAQRSAVRLLGTPSTCFQFLAGSDEFAIDPAPPAWRCLALLPDGRIDTTVHRLDC